jgi:hypothetical protein
MKAHELQALGRQMRLLSQSPKSDPVLKALTHLVWQLINEQNKNPDDANIYDMLMRMLREVHNAIAYRRRTGHFA